jgi:phage terminase large subunit-like protein
VPGDSIADCSWRGAFPDLADTVAVRHASGGLSTLGLKSYQQGRGAFEGTEQDVVWLDEEPPLDVYVECLVRTMTTGGLVLVTFTPLEGMSDVVLSFLDPQREAGA